MSLLELLYLLELLRARDGLMYLLDRFRLLILQLLESVLHQARLELHFLVLQSGQEHVLAEVALGHAVD